MEKSRRIQLKQRFTDIVNAAHSETSAEVTISLQNLMRARENMHRLSTYLKGAVTGIAEINQELKDSAFKDVESVPEEVLRITDTQLKSAVSAQKAFDEKTNLWFLVATIEENVTPEELRKHANTFPKASKDLPSAATYACARAVLSKLRTIKEAGTDNVFNSFDVSDESLRERWQAAVADGDTITAIAYLNLLWIRGAKPGAKKELSAEEKRDKFIRAYRKYTAAPDMETDWNASLKMFSDKYQTAYAMFCEALAA